jgi:energy-coupling factor transport system ATP-binding protein
VLAAERASFRYAASSRPVGPFDLAVERGEVHLLDGASGAGKSTLARMLTGVIPHLLRGESGGRVLVGGRSTCDVPHWQLAASVGFVAQNPAAQLLASSVRQEIVFGLENLGLGAREVRRRSDDALGRFALADLADRDPRRLSGGEQQRLVIAATFARRPDFIVLDEPLSMLDGESAAAVVGSLEEVGDAGGGLVLFEHRAEALRTRRALHRHVLGVRGAGEEPRLPDPARVVAPFRLELDNVSVERAARRALSRIDLGLESGRVYALVGPNGAGKTTLLRALTGLERFAGRIGVEGRRSADEARLGLCFQNPDRQFFNPTVGEEMRYGRDRLDEATYRGILALVGLSRYEQVSPLFLSEGEKKRLALAVLLAREDLDGLCIDEPTLGQDPIHRTRLGRIVRHLAAAGRLCVVATHDREWARRWCDEVVFLRAGRVVQAPAGTGPLQEAQVA